MAKTGSTRSEFTVSGQYFSGIYRQTQSSSSITHFQAHFFWQKINAHHRKIKINIQPSVKVTTIIHHK